jgi:uracil phosphoribosyltransferase
MKYKNVFISQHPFVIDSLSHLRNKYLDLDKFRWHSNQLCRLLFAEAIQGLNFKEIEVTTPLEVNLNCKKLEEEIIIITKLRSGLAMLFGALELLPKSKIGVVGFEKDEDVAKTREYYWRIPKIRKNSVVIITDPMLATGETVLHILEKIVPEKPKKIRVVCVVAAPEGIKKIKQKYPKVEIFTAAVDANLNEINFIVPGLGDYGDRFCGTSV